MKPLAQAFTIARIEAAFFARFPKLLIATLVVLLIPALYAVIYLSSVWDPAANTGALNVGLVNLDAGFQYHEHRFNIGQDLAAALKTDARFGFRDYHDEDEVRRAVRQGKLAFALILPRDFSANAIPGTQAGAGKPTIFVSEGNNYESAMIARHFADKLNQQINESLNEQR